MEVCLFEPEIAQNAGSIARLCACFGINLNIIEPASFIISDSKFKRAGMDYIDKTKIILHSSFQEFIEKYKGRIILLDTKATTKYYEINYRKNDCIMLGKESTGVPDEIYDLCNKKITIPMVKNARSINVSMSAAIAVSEAMRQINYTLCKQ